MTGGPDPMSAPIVALASALDSPLVAPWHRLSGFAGSGTARVVAVAAIVVLVVLGLVAVRRDRGLERWTLLLACLVGAGLLAVTAHAATEADESSLHGGLDDLGLAATDVEVVSRESYEDAVGALPQQDARWLSPPGQSTGRIRVAYDDDAREVALTLEPVEFPILRDAPGGAVVLRLPVDARGPGRACYRKDCRRLEGKQLFGRPVEWWRRLGTVAHATRNWTSPRNVDVPDGRVHRVVREDDGGPVECFVLSGRPGGAGARQVVDARCRVAKTGLPVDIVGTDPPVQLSGPPPKPIAVLTDPAVASTVSPEALLAAARHVAGRWKHLGDTVPPDRPVYVGSATLKDGGASVTFDVTVAFTAGSKRDGIRLSLEPANDLLADMGELRVTREGEEVDSWQLNDSGRVAVRLDPPVAKGDIVSVRLTGGYDVRDNTAKTAEGKPAFSAPHLSKVGDARLLAGWLPTLLFDDQSSEERVDGYGRNPTAIWSLRVTSDEPLLSGAWEADCPTKAKKRPCVWLQAVELPEVAVVVNRGAKVTRRSEPVAIKVSGGDEISAAVADWTARSLSTLADDLGPLPWRHLDVAIADLGDSGIEGLGFAGLLVVNGKGVSDTRFRPTLVAHEVSHQWLGGVVDADSLSGRLVLESLAVYLSWAVTDTHLADSESVHTLDYVAGAMGHLEDVGEAATPALPGPAVGDDVVVDLPYGRGAMAWFEAESSLGRSAVVSWIAGFVDARRGTLVDVDAVLERADGTLEDSLRRYWVETGEVPWISVLRDLVF